MRQKSHCFASGAYLWRLVDKYKESMRVELLRVRENFPRCSILDPLDRVAEDAADEGSQPAHRRKG